MQKNFPLLFLLLTLSACSHDEPVSVPPKEADPELYHDMIVLGDRLDDPYSLDNVKSAIASLYPTKAGRVDIEETHLYARFLPADETQLEELTDLGLELADHPFDYEILREGDYYHDPGVPEDEVTWQYAVVNHDFEFPTGIRYEILDHCYIPDGESTRADPDIDWNAVEREAFRLTGNEAMLEPETKAGSYQPEGRITIVDPRFDGGKPFGVAGVRVMTNVFVRYAVTYTDRDGYYKIPKKYVARPRYRLVFKNVRKFAIGINKILVPASVSTLGRGEPSGMDVRVTAESDRKLFCRCVVNNAAYDYIGRCSESDMDITPPPTDLRIWIFQQIGASSAVMIHHGAVVDLDVLGEYLGGLSGLVRFFGPDITIGAADHEDYASLYSSTVHELSHASHYAKVGDSYWNRYIAYIALSYFATNGETYGDGTGTNAGYCEVGEMWAYYLESKLYAGRYGGSMPPFGTSWWFYPQIFRLLDERGFTRAELFAALTAEVYSRERLQSRLLDLYPSRASVINQVFSRYAR